MPNLFANLIHVALKLKNECELYVPTGTSTQAYQALVCGSSLYYDSFAYDLRLTGLIHLMVVSGSHLIFISAFITRTPVLGRFNILRFLALIGFTLLTGLQAPCVRALIAIFLHELLSVRRVKVTSVTVCWFSGLLSCLLFPDFIFSLSFTLSIACALALAVTEGKSILVKSSYVYLFLLPILSLFSAPYPLTIVSNVILAPVLGFILFPLAIAGLFADPLSRIVHGCLEFLAFGGSMLRSEFLSGENLPKPAAILLWSYILVLHLYFHLNHIQKQRSLCRY